ncbi:hypothetical protein FHS04_002074 [Mesoflavibacter sabulilitoris]|uniref:Uncharacterized protein n=1 Tax=Mesoflavibacter zeaxanthinifaciens subsp. sabulilitoris TaxID=1520893 RepID=A0A2T1NLZ1_9FLAO|nr:hypothetical protein [Mesoflavibacter zeaxanthinifaciens]MBB3124551.1 hypothetical protein [Mesoflavibacter zeaxanthinifaciens subsp. sabulilitoris]PSG93918.1 hypothetical protein C7H61_01725 [Mesoflavibacter zeaxanthinifaciens subsp. sabulilitoris]
MTKKLVIIFISGLLLNSCKDIEKTNSNVQISNENNWSIQKLKDRAIQHLDSSKWDKELFIQDIETYNKYSDIFNSYPLNKSPFPVDKYDYAVSSIPFTIEKDSIIFKGVRIGEYENPESEKVIDKLTLLILSNDKDLEENTLVESRNYPYLTAQGIFKVTNNEYDWVFLASPDGFSTLLINMKLFDLRFGETIIIYPQMDKSFLYDQLEESPNNYEDFEDFKKVILNNSIIKQQIISEKKIK